MAAAGAARVLVVDDEPAVRESLGRTLRFEGYDVVEAADGVDALDAVEKHSPDLVILDVMMPRIDGLDVLRAVRSNPRTAGVPVVMFTAAGEGELRDHAMRQGATGYWVKGSLDLMQLDQHLSNYLGQAG